MAVEVVQQLIRFCPLVSRCPSPRSLGPTSARGSGAPHWREAHQACRRGIFARFSSHCGLQQARNFGRRAD
jgi:hypothetical protein